LLNTTSKKPNHEVLARRPKKSNREAQARWQKKNHTPKRATRHLDLISSTQFIFLVLIAFTVSHHSYQAV
jgi:hypothetical protein